MDKNIIFGVIFAIIALGSMASATYFYFKSPNRLGIFLSALTLAPSLGLAGGFLTKHQSRSFVELFPKGGSAHVLASFTENEPDGRLKTKYLIGNVRDYQVTKLPNEDFINYSNSLKVPALMAYPAGTINLTRSGDGSGAITEIEFVPENRY